MVSLIASSDLGFTLFCKFILQTLNLPQEKAGEIVGLSLLKFFSQGFRKEEKTTKCYLHQLSQLINPVLT